MKEATDCGAAGFALLCFDLFRYHILECRRAHVKDLVTTQQHFWVHLQTLSLKPLYF